MFFTWFLILTGIYLLYYGGMIIYDLFGQNLKKGSAKVESFRNTDSDSPGDVEEESTVVAETNMQEGTYDVFDPQINPYAPPLTVNDDLDEEPTAVTGGGTDADDSPSEYEEPVSSDESSVESESGSQDDSDGAAGRVIKEAEEEMIDIDPKWEEMLTSAAMESALATNSPTRSRYTAEVLSI